MMKTSLLLTALLLQGSAVLADEKPVLTVAVARVASRQVPSVVHGTGSVVPWKEVGVSAEVQGVRISDVAVEAGDRVEAGTVLATLDRRTLDNAVSKAEAAERSAASAVAVARSALDRGTALVASKAVSAESVENLQLTLNQAQASLDQASVALSDARQDAAHAVLTSPYAGTVLSVAQTAGMLSTTASALVVIVRDARLEVASDIPEKYLTAVRAGQPVSVTRQDGGTETGTVRLVAPEVDTATHLGRVFVTLPADTALRTGMFSRVSVTTSERTLVVVPPQAVTYRGNAAKVFRIGVGAVVEAVSVVPGDGIDGLTAVEGGLREGDTVVVSGAGFVEDGNRVTVSAGTAL